MDSEVVAFAEGQPQLEVGQWIVDAVGKL